MIDDGMYLNAHGLAKLADLVKNAGYTKTFVGTQDEWDALTTEQKNQYDTAEIIDE